MESGSEDRYKEEHTEIVSAHLANRPSSAHQIRMARPLNTKFSDTTKISLDYDDSPTYGKGKKIPPKKRKKEK